MSRKFLAILAAVATSATMVNAPSFASEVQEVVQTTASPRDIRVKVMAAAEKVCRKAVEHDNVDDYGSVQECVDNTIRSAKVQPLQSASVSSTACVRFR